MTAGAHTPRNRREAEVLARLVQLLADGVAFDPAVWSVTDRGREMDTARLVDLFDGHRRASAAPGASVATPATSASHTPGPWSVAHGLVAGPDGRRLAAVFLGSADSRTVGEGEANARLIAAAPELLRVARLALEELEWFPAIRHTKTLREDLRRAIAAATSASDTTTTEHPGA